MKLTLMAGESIIRDGQGTYTNKLAKTGTWYITNKRLCFYEIPAWKIGLFGIFSYLLSGTKQVLSINLDNIISVRQEDKLLSSICRIRTSETEFIATFNSETSKWLKELIRAISLYTDNKVYGDENAFETTREE